MDLMKQLTMTVDDELQIIVTKDFEIDSCIKGYHVSGATNRGKINNWTRVK